MRASDAAGVLALIGCVALWMGLTDGMLRYLRPTMRPWLVAAGISLVLLAVGVGIAAWRDRRQGSGELPGCDDHRRRLGLVGWMLLMPVLAAWCVDPAALGAYAARQQSGFSTPVIDFDLAAHIESHSFSGQDVELQMHELVIAANSDEADRALLADVPVRLRGFVVPKDDGHGFLLARFMIGCCAGDAVGFAVDIPAYDGPPLDEDVWVEVTGRFDAAASATQERDELTDSYVPVLRAETVHQIDEPDSPYEYPR